MASYSDDFNRSDENPLSDGGKWDDGPGSWPGMKLVSNRARTQTANTSGTARRNTPLIGNAQFSRATCYSAATNHVPYVCTRIASTSDGDCYLLETDYLTSALKLTRYDDSGGLTGNALGASFGTFASGDVLELQSVGILHVAKQNGTVIATRVDNTYSGGQPGIGAYAETSEAFAEIDGAEGGDQVVTRLYLPASGAAPINFAFSAGWEKTSDADRISAVTAKSNTALTDKTCSENVSTTPYDVLARQYCYGPLAAQTIAGTVRGVIRVLESNAQADFRAQLVIKVMANDGSTVRGTLLDFDTQALKNEFPTTAASRMFPLNWDTVVLTSVNAQAGDYLVIEIGIRSHNSSTTNLTATFRFGDPTGGSDRTEDETATDDNVPWLEFTQAITLQSGSDGTSAGVATVTGVGAAVAQTAGSGAGVATPSGAGSSIAQAEGDADGIAAASGAAAAVTPADGASAGAAQATGETQAIAGAAGDADGQAAASGAGAALVQSEGDADGAATAQAAGSSIVQTEGVSQGQATAQGQGEDAAAGGSTGTASGASTASGEGAAIVQSEGDSNGAAVASGAGAAIKTGAGSAQGQAQAEADVALIKQAEAIAAAAAAALGAGGAIAQAEGQSAGQATAAGQSETGEPITRTIAVTVHVGTVLRRDASIADTLNATCHVAKYIHQTVHV